MSYKLSKDEERYQAEMLEWKGSLINLILKLSRWIDEPFLNSDRREARTKVANAILEKFKESDLD